MKIKLLLTILLLAETITANAQNAEKEYLKKVYVCNLALQKVVDSATVEDEAGTENVTDTELNTEN